MLSQMDSVDTAFSRRGMLAGARQALPLGVSVFAVGAAFGLLARQAGLTLAEAVAMSALVFAGAAQIVALGLWSTPLPVVAIVLTTLVVNLRYVLLGAALRPWFRGLSAWKSYLSVFFMADENWALSMGAFARGEGDRAHLLGGGLLLWASWVLGAIVGRTAGAAIQNPAQWGLDFAITAAFIGLLAGLWRGRGDLLPWVVAAAVAVAAAHWLPGKWYILLGGLAGSLSGLLDRAR